MMADKTGDAHLDHLIDQNSGIIRQLEHFAKEKAKENDQLIKRIHESRAKRLERETE